MGWYFLSRFTFPNIRFDTTATKLIYKKNIFFDTCKNGFSQERIFKRLPLKTEIEDYKLY